MRIFPLLCVDTTLHKTHKSLEVGTSLSVHIAELLPLKCLFLMPLLRAQRKSQDSRRLLLKECPRKARVPMFSGRGYFEPAGVMDIRAFGSWMSTLKCLFSSQTEAFLSSSTLQILKLVGELFLAFCKLFAGN